MEKTPVSTSGRHATAFEPDVETLLNLHTARRRLMIALQRRQRLGEPVESLEAELAALQREVQHMLASFAAPKEDGAR